MSEMEPKRPRYWTTMEELNGDPNVERLRTEEFYEKPSELMNEAGEVNFHLSRRDLLKLSGATMVFAAVGCARRPVEKIIPYVIAPEEIVPGIPTYYASTCTGCSAGCGTVVKTREGRPIKLEGNPKHPVNHGKLCARGQATVLDLYDPDRLQQPVKYYRGKHTTEQIDFAAIDDAVLNVLKKGQRVAFITGAVNGPAAKRAQREFLAAYPNIKLYTYDPLGDDDLLHAQEICYGTSAKPRYHFDSAEYVILLGSDPFGTSASPIEAAYGFGIARKPGKDGMMKVVSFEPAMTVTGANADERFLVKPEHLASIAFAIAQYVNPSAIPQFVKDEDNRKFLDVISSFHPAQIERDAGLEAGTLKRIASEIVKYRGKSIVIGGSTVAQGNNSLSLQIATTILNSLLGNDGRTIDGTNVYSQQRTGQQHSIIEFSKDVKAGKFDAVIFAGVNPVYSAPADLGLAEAIAKIGFVATLSDRIDETAKLSDWILPLSNGLEAWQDHEAINGTFAVRQPVITPLYTSRSIEECYLTWTAAKNGILKPPTMLDFIQDTWKQAFMKDASQSTFIDWWNDKLRDGVFITARTESHSEPRKLLPEVASYMHVRKPDTDALQLVLTTSSQAWDGGQSNNTWLKEMPDPMTRVAWDNYLAIAPSTAKKLGLETNEVVKLSTGGRSVDAPVFIQPGVHPDVVTLALGWGRTAGGRVANNVGINGFALAQVDGERIQFSGIPVSLSKTGRTYKLANTQGHNYVEGRPIVQETTFDKWLEKPNSGGRGPREHESLWGAYPPKLNPPTTEPIRWAMTIDINSCIGCNACAIACQAENNIAVVGKEEVIRGREMSWIRIDRYFSGDEDNPEVTHTPMLCQHCANAPCETVCPVVATTHNDEGLNVQTYNRCVGTRYCSNNCPYKVRRFNWLVDNTPYSAHNIQHPMEMVFNPDVTVRSIGVMEKCTFCVQRIREGHEFRRANGLPVIPDGHVKPACAQTCPTQAITFGNLLNQDSEVAKVSNDPRGYRVLDDLNTRPGITYLRKLRHRSEKPWDKEEEPTEHADLIQHNHEASNKGHA